MCHYVGTMNIKVLSLSAVVALSGLIACTAEQPDNVGAADQNATSDIDHMFKRPDGKFDVTCSDGTTQSGLTAEEINMNLACGGPATGGTTSGGTTSGGTTSGGTTSGGTAGSSGSAAPTSCLNTDPIDHTQIPYVKARPTQAGACSAADITELGAYYKAHVQDPDFTALTWSTSVNAACSSCVFSADSNEAPATAWGPIVIKDDQIDQINRGGCIEQVSGKESCGRAYQQFQTCLMDACLKDCKTQADFTACRGDQRVLTTACKGAAEAIRTECGSGISAYETACKGTSYTFDGPIKVACVTGAGTSP